MESSGLVLGLDIGVASIGWALADLKGKQIEAAGVRIFDAAMDSGKFEAGDQGASHAVARRQARLQRRQLRRRAARQRDLYVALQESGLLPFAGKKAEDRHREITDLDKALRETWRPRIREESPDIAEPDLILCYYLRGYALGHRLEPFELGRALYHLGQRRGFKSNRREGRATIVTSNENGNEADRSEIKSSISNLAAELDAENLTLGQRLARIDPHRSAIRNRKRSDIPPIWTGREMYEKEFDRIWEAQLQHHPDVLTDALRRRIQKLMFWQRRISPGKPGRCELERNPPRDRAPRSSLLAQHFRIVQAVNNLRIAEHVGLDRKLTADERRLLINVLETVITYVRGKKRNSELFGLRFTAVKETLGLPKRAKLNLDDEAADSYLRGNRTNALMVRAFGHERWSSFTDSERRRIVRKWIKEQSPEKLLTMAMNEWGLDREAATQLAGIEPEAGYAALSHVAMLNLLPVMEQEGLTYGEAVAKVYGNIFSGDEPENYLRPVEKVLTRVPNPVVMRALTELRKVINAIVREYKKPSQIRIELARSLKRTAEQRQRDFAENKNRRRERQWAKDIIEKDLKQRASRDAIDRILLHRECQSRSGEAVCVYCGKSLGGYAEIFSPASAIEVEHILPKRCQDDSFSNKVLAHRNCNLEKGDRTPFQAFGGDPRWGGMLDRVERLGNKGRLDRFKIELETELQEFTNRHLSDTRYASKLAAQYVEGLYGGRDAALPWEDRNRRCVYVSSGALTARLRRGWKLEAILNEPAPASNGQGGKARTDHRHHAIDAIVIALTSEAMVKQAAIESEKHDRRNGYLLPRYFPPPWPLAGNIEDRVDLFKADIERVVDTINVSHRPDRKLNGPLHKATYYSPKKTEASPVYARVAVHELSDADIDDPETISDPSVRNAVQQEFATVGRDRKKLEKSLPYLDTRKGKVPIRHVRIRIPGKKLVPVRDGRDQPTVAAKENHHVAIFEIDDPTKGFLWYAPPPVTLMQAMRRKATRDKDPNVQVVRTSDGRNARFVFHLMKGDMVEMFDSPSGRKRVRGKVSGQKDLYVIDSLSEGDYSFSRHTKSLSAAKADGAKLGQLEERGDRIRIRSIDELRKRECRKVEVDPLGCVHYLSPPLESAGGIGAL
jgi:CRISPR-associated endonuclease Csn1